MTLTLDSASEQRIQREIERGNYCEPVEVVAHALALLDDREEMAISDIITGYKHSDEVFEHVGHSPAITGEEARKAIDRAFGIWADLKEDGVVYQERLRSEW